MAFLTGSSTLEDALGQQAQQATAQTNDVYNQQRKWIVSRLAANGQLMGGTASYPLTDLDTGRAQDLSGIQSNLASSLGGIPSEDWLNQKQFNRNLALTNYIGSLMQPSTLDEVFAGIGAAGKIGGKIAAFKGA